MPNILLESEFLTIDLTKLFNEPEPIPENPIDLEAIKDWKEELNRRLVDNQKLDSEHRKKEYEVKDIFWKDYFNTVFKDPEVAENLINMGPKLRKAIEVLGFNTKTNPILAFVSQNYVQKQLIKTKLLNALTFEVIFNAAVKKLLTNQDLSKTVGYNIIYCRDLYTKSTVDILKYLQIQSEKLGANPTDDIKAANIQTFLAKGKATNHSNAKLKTLAEISKASTPKTNATSKSTGNSTATTNFISTIKSTTQAQAVLQYIATNFGSDVSDRAFEALKAFGDISVEKLVPVAKDLNKILSKMTLQDTDAELIVNTLERYRKNNAFSS